MAAFQQPCAASVLEGHESGVTALALAPNQSLLLSGSADGEVRAWSPSGAGALLSTWRGHARGKPVWSLAFTADSALAVSACADRTVRVWRSSDGRCTCVLSGHLKDVLHLLPSTALCPGPLLYSAGADGLLILWDCEREARRPGAPEAHPAAAASEQAHRGAVRALLGHPRDSALCFTAGSDGRVLVWRRSIGDKQQQQLRCAAELRAAGVETACLALHCASASVGTLYAATEDGCVHAWSLRMESRRVLSCAPLPLLRCGEECALRALALSPDGDSLFAATAHGALLSWRAHAARAGAHSSRAAAAQPWPERHSAPLKMLLLSRDGAHLYSAGLDGVLRQWRAASGRCTARLEGHEGAVAAALLSRSGTALFTAGADRAIRAWSVAPPPPQGRSCMDGVVAEQHRAGGALRAHTAAALLGALQTFAAPSVFLWRRVTAALPRRREREAEAQPTDEEHVDYHPRHAP